MKYNNNGEVKELNLKVMDTLPIGSVVEYSGNTVPDGWVEISDNSKVLWENPSPNQAFAAQTISLNSTEPYSYYEIVYRFVWQNIYSSVTKFPVFNNTVLIVPAMHGFANYTVNRLVYDVSYNSISFSEAMLTTGDVNNDFCIPVKIIGYK